MIDKTQLDNYIIGLAKIRDKEINKILRKHIRKAGNKANTEYLLNAAYNAVCNFYKENSDSITD